jgi:peroxiredoxin
MRLREGLVAPPFEVIDCKSRHVLRLADFQGQWLWLSFHRYAACPFCNLHVHELMQRFDELATKSIQVIALFRSEVDRTTEQYGKREVPFIIAADPTLAAYRQYGVEKSLLGMLVSFIHPRGLLATAKGFFPGKVDADVRSLPADFLITPDQHIAIAYYSSNITQHLAIERVLDFVSKQTFK